MIAMITSCRYKAVTMDGVIAKPTRSGSMYIGALDTLLPDVKTPAFQSEVTFNNRFVPVLVDTSMDSVYLLRPVDTSDGIIYFEVMR